MKKHLTIMMAALFLGTASTAAAADYSRYSNDELLRMRGTMRNADVEERTAYRNEWQKRAASMNPEERQLLGKKGIKKQNRCRSEVIKETLGISDAQQKKLDELRQKQFATASKERSQLFSLRQEIRNESLKKNPDGRKIAMLSEKIGTVHTGLARIRSSHLQEMASILTPDQIEKMKTFTQDKPGKKRVRTML
jgi:Spy/CpxP family protein refolding chaperone